MSNSPMSHHLKSRKPHELKHINTSMDVWFRISDLSRSPFVPQKGLSCGQRRFDHARCPHRKRNAWLPPRTEGLFCKLAREVRLNFGCRASVLLIQKHLSQTERLKNCPADRSWAWVRESQTRRQQKQPIRHRLPVQIFASRSARGGCLAHRETPRRRPA